MHVVMYTLESQTDVRGFVPFSLVATELRLEKESKKKKADRYFKWVAAQAQSKLISHDAPLNIGLD